MSTRLAYVEEQQLMHNISKVNCNDNNNCNNNNNCNDVNVYHTDMNSNLLQNKLVEVY